MSRAKKDPETNLEVFWSKKERDVMVRFPNKPDGHYIIGSFCHPRVLNENVSIVDELKARGYDITTLKFSIQKFSKPKMKEWVQNSLMFEEE